MGNESRGCVVYQKSPPSGRSNSSNKLCACILLSSSYLYINMQINVDRVVVPH